jgi:DDE_Tnp_1-associated/Transposase DDE domain
VPAESSLPIEPAISYLARAVAGVGTDRASLLQVLAAVADPRKRRGVRHRLPVILAVSVCAVLAGARSYVAIAEWAADADPATLAELGVGGVVPCESTIRRTLQSVDADALDERLGAWAAARTSRSPARLRPIAVDGKTLRGSAAAGDPGRHLLAAFDHAHGVVFGQVDVAAKTNEIPMFTALLDRIDLTRAVITADALCRSRHNASYVDVRVMPLVAVDGGLWKAGGAGGVGIITGL